MKGYLSILGIALFAISSSLPVEAQDTSTYVDQDIEFSIKRPSAWKNTKITGGNVVVLFTGGSFNRNLQVMYDKGGEKEGTAALDRLAKILRTQKIISAEWKEVNARRAFFQVVEWQSPLGTTRAIRLMVPSGNHYFLVMGVCPSADWDSLGPMLEECVLSFKLP